MGLSAGFTEMLGRARDQHAVAVGRRLGDVVRRDRGARARAVLDDDGLAEVAAEAARRGARDRVRRAAGREAHDEADGLGGIAPGASASAPKVDAASATASARCGSCLVLRSWCHAGLDSTILPRWRLDSMYALAAASCVEGKHAVDERLDAPRGDRGHQVAHEGRARRRRAAPRCAACSTRRRASGASRAGPGCRSRPSARRRRSPRSRGGPRRPCERTHSAKTVPPTVLTTRLTPLPPVAFITASWKSRLAGADAEVEPQRASAGRACPASPRCRSPSRRAALAACSAATPTPEEMPVTSTHSPGCEAALGEEHVVHHEEGERDRRGFLPRDGCPARPSPRARP